MTTGPVASDVFSKPRWVAQGFDMGTVVCVVRGKKTDVFGIRKGQVVVAKTTGHQPVSSHAHDLDARSVQCGAWLTRTCRVMPGEARWQALRGLGRFQRPGASQRLYRRQCRLRSS